MSVRSPGKTFRLVVFDFDGTLVDTGRDIAASINHTLTSLSLAPRSAEEITSFVGRGVASLIKEALGDQAESLFARALKIFRRHYKEHCLDQTKLYPYVENVLQEIPVRLKAIVTNKPQVYTEIILDGLGIGRFFDRVLGGDNVPNKKPAPDPVHILMGEFEVSPEAVLVVGDSPFDVRMGKAAGTRTCAVTYGYGKEDALKSENPDFVVTDFSGILHIFG